MRTKKFRNCILSFGFLMFFMLFLSLNSISITVQAADEDQEIKLNVHNVSIAYEKSFTLKVYNTTESQAVTFKSSNAEIASVSSKGVITGVSDGTAAITVIVNEKGKDDTKLQCDVLIGRPAISVKFDRTEVTLGVDRKITLKTLLLPSNTVEIAKFYSDNPSVANISSTGRIRTKEIGKTNVYAVLDNGKSVSCEITVVDEAAYQKLIDNKETPEATTIPANTNNNLTSTGS